MTAHFTGTLAGKRVRRLGFGTMRLTGTGVWGEPASEKDAVTVLRSAVNLGIQHIDTADAYGPCVAEDLIRKALFPYPDDLVIATKGGFTRHGPGRWVAWGVPAYLRQCVELSLRRLHVEAIDLYYLHRIDPNIPLADQVGELELMRQEGKLNALGLSKVNLTQIQEAKLTAPIAAIQNSFSLTNHEESGAVVDWCQRNHVAFVPYAPLGAGKLVTAGESVGSIEALSWLLHRSPTIFPIPGTSRLEHLKENLRADVL